MTLWDLHHLTPWLTSSYPSLCHQSHPHFTSPSRRPLDRRHVSVSCEWPGKNCQPKTPLPRKAWLHYGVVSSVVFTNAPPPPAQKRHKDPCLGKQKSHLQKKKRSGRWSFAARFNLNQFNQEPDSRYRVHQIKKTRKGLQHNLRHYSMSCKSVFHSLHIFCLFLLGQGLQIWTMEKFERPNCQFARPGRSWHNSSEENVGWTVSVRFSPG